MSGKQHLLGGGALCALIVTDLTAGSRFFSEHPFLFSDVLSAGIRTFAHIMDPGGITWIFACIGCYLIGCLLPDIDNPASMLGRYVHVPGGHRTWTHSIFAFLVFAALGIRWSVFAWMAAGYFSHLFLDSFSKCGNCWVRFSSGYRKYPNGGKIKKGRHLVLYANETAAWIFCTVLVMFAAFHAWMFRTDLLSLFSVLISEGLF